MAIVKHLYGTFAEYQSWIAKAENANSDAIVFVYDDLGNQRLYRGAELIASHNVDFVTSVPTADAAVEGRLYVVNTTDSISLYAKHGGVVEEIGGAPKAGSITELTVFNSELIATTINADSTDDQLATAKAVNDALEAAKEEMNAAVAELDGAYVDVSASRSEDNTGTVLKFTTKGGEYKEVTVGDLFLTSASYDSNSHILSLTVQGGDTVDVDLQALVPQAVSTADVAMARNIVATVTVGNITKGQTIDISKITDIQTFLETMLSQDSLPTATQPSVTLTTPNNTAYEVGTSVTPIAYAVFSVGSYSQTAAKNQVASGVTLEDDTNGVAWTLKCTGQDDKTYPASIGNSLGSASSPISFDPITVEDSTSVAVTVTAKHSKGNDPLSYLGNSEVDGTLCSTKTIAAGTKSDTNNPKITGFRYCWYGYKGADDAVDDPTTLTVEQIKALGNQAKSLPTTITADKMKQMFFAVPATWASGLAIPKGTNSPLPQTVKGPYTVQVGGVDNYSPIAYNVFYVSNDTAASGADTYQLTWS